MNWLYLQKKERRKYGSKSFISAEEVFRELEVSDSFAYWMVRKLNDELERQGFVVVKGKIGRKYFEEHVYGISEASIIQREKHMEQIRKEQSLAQKKRREKQVR